MKQWTVYFFHTLVNRNRIRAIENMRHIIENELQCKYKAIEEKMFSVKILTKLYLENQKSQFNETIFRIEHICMASEATECW